MRQIAQADSLARPLAPGILVEGLALEFIGLQFEPLIQINTPDTLLPDQRDKIEAAAFLCWAMEYQSAG